MAKSLADVLAAEDDAGVCTGLYSLLIMRYGKHFDAASIPEEHRNVFLVWHTNALIANGGFNGFFKTDLPIDPEYVHMRAAYEALECEPVSAAVRRVFEAFPNHTPPIDPAERLRHFVKANNTFQGALNRDFLKATNDLTAALAAYIRKHAEAFASVEKPANPYAVAETMPVTPVLSSGRADAAEIGLPRLPRWARAAYYAHCAHLVLKLWEPAWPEAPHEYRDGVEQAIILAELCAAQGQEVGGIKGATTLAVQAAEAAAATDPTVRMGAPAPDDPALVVNIAIAAASSLDFISGDEEANPYDFAKAAIETAKRVDLMEQVQEDFQKLKKYSREGGWTDKTPVPPEVFRADFDPRGKSWWKRW